MRITGGVAGPDGAANAQQLFKKIDADGDGKVTKEEFTAGAPKRGGRPGPSVDDLFNRIDTNGDGSVDEGENTTFLESAKSRRPGRPDAAAMAKKLFQKTDADQDGAVSQSELEASLKAHVDQRATLYSADGRSSVPTGPTFSRVA